jgi:hypothetical protein
MRTYHRIRALLTGYFWLPCPNCGRMFGGHEKGGGTLWHSIGEGRMCCPRCTTDVLPNAGIQHPPYHIEVDVDDQGRPTGPHRYVYDTPPS